MATIVCPYCEHPMHLKALKPGKFKPQCVKCKKSFGLLVPAAATDDATMFGFTLSELSQPTLAFPPENFEGEKRQKPKPLPPTTQQETRIDLPTQGGVLGTDGSGAATVDSLPLPSELGGYRLLSELGRGGLGVVYLANQISLQRKVALKVIRGGLARNATVIARFIREAYAAAQLTHHNVVQIYDLGTHSDTNFFSMEYVDGQNLADIMKTQGRLPAEQAAGYILQAARGLQFAHSQGMVHRDIKPANLMLSSTGVIKVADLGLVKVAGDDPIATHRNDNLEFPRTPSTSQNELTSYGTTLGTANYMAPEQASDPSRVDHRADIYSLGCTFYALLSGSPPFKGKSLEEVVSHHKTLAIPRIEKSVDRLPPALTQIVNRMMEKRPEDRYQSLGEAIRDLENYLGVHSGKDFHPAEKDVQVLEQAAAAFNSAPALIFRNWLPRGFAVVSVVLLVFALIFHWTWSVPVITFAVTSTLSYFVSSGIGTQAHWMERVRELVWGRRLHFLFRLVITVASLVALSWLLDTFAITLLAAIMGVGVGWVHYFVSDHALKLQRADAVRSVEQLLKHFRISGIDEEALHLFFAKYAGNDWEEFFEELFGYPAKLQARTELARVAANGRKNKFRPWLDNWLESIDRQLAQRKRRLDRKKLGKVELAALRQQGLSAAAAEQQADVFASALVSEAADLKQRFSRSPMTAATADPSLVAQQKKLKINKLMEEARLGKHRQNLSFTRRLDPYLLPLIGPMTRFVLGLILVISFGFWVRANIDFSPVASGEATQALKNMRVDVGDSLTEFLRLVGFGKLSNSTVQLSWPGVGKFLSGFGALIAGAILLFSSLMRGWQPSLLLLPAALLILMGPPLGLPGLPILGGSLGTASLVAVVAFFGSMLIREQNAEN